MPQFAATRVSNKSWYNRRQFHKNYLVQGARKLTDDEQHKYLSRMVWPSEPLSSDSAGIWVRLMSAISSPGLLRTLCTVRNLDTISTYMFGAVWWKAESPISNKCGAKLCWTNWFDQLANSFSRSSWPSWGCAPFSQKLFHCRSIPAKQEWKPFSGAIIKLDN